ncbi:MAG TPA: choice-of-anchor Q domain-containing protein [Niabella sp.]|nr:choice-of-anchor Q domain-containing protein [Niabella sp.]
MKQLLFLTAILFFTSFIASGQTIRYVKHEGTGTGTGSWANASGDLQAMINASADNDEIWVAGGTYTSSGTSTSGGFKMGYPIKLYGGFAGTEFAVAERDVDANETILSGNNTNYHTVVIADAFDAYNPEILIDGFTIADGKANGTGSANGINRDGGGGLFVYTFGVTTVQNCTFRNNSAGFRGGAVYISGTTNIYHSKFIQNTVTGNNSTGGAVFNNNAALNIVNALFIGNTAYSSGGAVGISQNAGTTNIINATFHDNKIQVPPTNEAIFIARSNVATIANSIIWEDGTWNPIGKAGGITYDIKNSIIRLSAPPANAGIINQDPLFVNAAAGNFTLQPTSLAINAGDNNSYNTAAYGGGDLARYHRIAGTTIDIGAYESGSTPLPVTFGSISAIVKAGKLLVSWQTETETSNSHFEIEGSADGVHFTKIATIVSKAENGNSDTLLEYNWEAGAEALAGISWLIVLIGMGLLRMAAKYRRPLLMLALILVSSCIYISCTKQTDMTVAGKERYFIRIKQVDIDGGFKYSKAVEVVF